MDLQPPLLFAFDLGDLVYIILPLLWVAGQFFASKKEEEEKPSEAEMAERRRRIQEEIRKRIEAQRENKGASSGSDSGHANSHPANEAQARTRTEEPRRTSLPSQPTAERPETPRYDPYRAEQDQRRRQPEPSQTAPTPAPSTPGSSIEERLAEQRRRLAEAERMREEAFAKASSVTSHVPKSHSRRKEKSAPAFGGWDFDAPMGDQLRGALSNPAAARTAIVIGEVLGPPVGLRDDIGERLI
jgi:hypothetical protein